MRMRAIGLVVLLIMVGCTSQEPAPPTPTPVEYPKVDPPKDRDERAVIAALRQIDACALLDPIGGNKPAATHPHQCAVRGDGLSVSVTLGTRFEHEHKYAAAPLDLGGAKAYLTSDPAARFCKVTIPVSFALAITVLGFPTSRSGGGDSCTPTKSAATVAATRLASPPPGAAMSWTACDLLAEIDPDAVLEIDEVGGLDECRASERGQDQQPGKSLFWITLEYGDDPTNGAEDVRTIAGQRVAVRSDTSGCWFLWSMVTFHADDCATGEPLVPKLIAALASTNPDRTSPQRPLVIPTDEPDEPLVDACVDWPWGGSCQPSSDMPVPEGAQAVLAAAAADARVACAVANDALRAQFGPAMAPVLGSPSTERPHCHFVEPGHTIDVELSVLPDEDLSGGVVSSDGRDLTVAGRPAKSVSNSSYSELCLLPVSGAKTGLLCLKARFLPGRGKEPPAPADTSKAAQLEPAVTEIVTRYFS